MDTDSEPVATRRYPLGRFCGIKGCVRDIPHAARYFGPSTVRTALTDAASGLPHLRPPVPQNRPTNSDRAVYFATGSAPVGLRSVKRERCSASYFDGIHWVIVGGESGAEHRPMNLMWARDIRDQCQRARVPFFFKQVGGVTPKAGGRLLDGREWNQMPVVAKPRSITGIQQAVAK
jgi:hypothetical protein